MSLGLVTNVAPVIGSLALLLNPTPEFDRLNEGLTNQPAPAGESAPARSEYFGGDWGGRRGQWAEQGFDFSVQYIGEMAANVSGGQKRGAVYDGLLAVATDVDLEKAVGWRGGAWHAALLYPHGRSASEEYVGDLFILSNLDATDEPRLFEFWVEQNFASDTVSLRLGQIAVDQEFAFTELGALFCNSAFGWFPIAGVNVPAPVYPQGAPAVRLAWHPRQNFFAQAAVFDGNVNPLDAAGAETNPHGVKFRFAEGAFVIAEAGYRWGQISDAVAHPGSLKIGGWHHTADFGHVRWDNTGLSLGNPLSSGQPQQLEGNWGIYIAGEQTLWHEVAESPDSTQGLGLFSRLGYAPSDRNLVEFYAEFGVTYMGLLPTRDDDVCGIGIAYGQMSGELEQLGNDLNLANGTTDPTADFEFVIEFEYQCQMRAGWKLQPGLQYIVHPGGSGTTANALVLTVRNCFEF